MYIYFALPHLSHSAITGIAWRVYRVNDTDGLGNIRSSPPPPPKNSPEFLYWWAPFFPFKVRVSSVRKTQAFFISIKKRRVFLTLARNQLRRKPQLVTQCEPTLLLIFFLVS